MNHEGGGWMNLKQIRGSGASAQGTIPATFFHLLVRDESKSRDILEKIFCVRHTPMCLLLRNDGACKLEIESLYAMQLVCTNFQVSKTQGGGYLHA